MSKKAEQTRASCNSSYWMPLSKHTKKHRIWSVPFIYFLKCKTRKKWKKVKKWNRFLYFLFSACGRRECRCRDIKCIRTHCTDPRHSKNYSNNNGHNKIANAKTANKKTQTKQSKNKKKKTNDEVVNYCNLFLLFHQLLLPLWAPTERGRSMEVAVSISIGCICGLVCKYMCECVRLQHGMVVLCIFFAKKGKKCLKKLQQRQIK